MSITYDDALEMNEPVSRSKAESECLRHSVSVEEMVRDLGDKTEYPARELLGWLGY